MLTMRQKLSAAAAVACLATSGCGGERREEDQASDAANAAREQVVPKLPVPVPEPPLDRERLLLAAMHAASDFSAGADDAQRQKELAGKKFEFRFRFGCQAPENAVPAGPFGWTLNEKSGALKVRAELTLSSKDAPVKRIAGEAFETVEGFWVERPWMLSAACPPSEAKAETGPPPSGAKAGAEAPRNAAITRTVGIAQFFTAAGPRTMRRSGRPYEATKKLEAGEKPAGGFDLVLSGRLAPLPNGKVIACTRADDGERPNCIVSVEFGRVWIERADTHEQLAQWGSG